MRRRAMFSTLLQPKPVEKYIQFEDPEAERVLMSKGVSSDGIGITLEDAARVTSISNWFKGNTSLTSFDELRYFTKVTSLGFDAFVNAANLASIDLSNIESIADNAFYRTSLGGNFNLPKLTSIGPASFRGTKIESFVAENLLSIPNGEGNGGTFHDCKSLTYVSIPSATFIGKDAFVNATSLTSVEMQNVETIGKYAFKNTRLTGDLILPKLNAVGSAAFRETKITSFVAKNLVSIEANDGGGGAFFNCPNLTSVELEAITSMGADAFAACPSLKKAIIRATTPPILGSYAFNNSANAIIYVPDASVEAYKTGANWNSYADRIRPLSEIEGSLVFYDKLVGDGTAFINTEYYPKGTDTFDYDVTPKTTNSKFVWGVKSNSISLGELLYTKESSYFLYGPTAARDVGVANVGRLQRKLQVTLSDNGQYFRTISAGNTLVNLAQGTGSYFSATAENPLLLFACQQSVATGSYPDGRRSDGALWSFKITDIEGNTIMSLKPCTWNGEAGMWDEVGGKFYGSATTAGAFTAEND